MTLREPRGARAIGGGVAFALIFALTRPAFATCNPSDVSGCPSTCPGTGDIPGTAWPQSGVAGVHAVCGIVYNGSYSNCGAASNHSCTVMDCYYPLNAGPATPMLRGDHSGGGNSGNRDQWLGL